MKYKIHVTEEDILKSKDINLRDDYAKYACCCPIALAISRELDREAVVGPEHVVIGNNRYKLSENVIDKIYKFDKYEEMEPFNFFLDLVEI